MADKGYSKIRNDIIRNPYLSPNEKIILILLISYQNCEKIYMSQNTIANQLGIERKTVNRVIKLLEEKKYIKTEILPDRSSLLYILYSKAVVPEMDKVVPETDRGCTQNGQGVVPKKDTIKKSIKKKILKGKEKGEVDLPNWLDIPTFNAYVEHRKKKKAPMTDHAKQLIIKKLEPYKDKHVEIINKSIENGWTGIFPEDNKKHCKGDFIP